ncbi:MAG TPA: hypothetical protein VGL78_15075 [Solirubrobacteraceae bacterium]
MHLVVRHSLIWHLSCCGSVIRDSAISGTFVTSRLRHAVDARRHLRSTLSAAHLARERLAGSLAGVRAIEAGECPSLNYEQMIRLAHVLGVEPSAIVVRAESLDAE